MYVALGLMSGTSLDGVDAAFLKTDGQVIDTYGASLSLPYSVEERQVLQHAVEIACAWKFKGLRPDFSAAEVVLHDSHVRAVQGLYELAPVWAEKLDIVGFHGQTVVHQAAQGARLGQTLQIGDGAALARTLHVPVVSDFRQADVKAGGQGAPFAPVYHRALAVNAGLAPPCVLLNIGGVANISLIETETQLYATDTGPGNGELDRWIAQNGAGNYDLHGHYSLAGQINHDMLERWMQRPFFRRAFPRSADRHEFNLLADMNDCSLADGAATLSAFTVASIVRTITQMRNRLTSPLRHLVICGGGRYNMAMVTGLKAHFPDIVRVADDFGWSCEAIEAQAFGFLAVRSQEGLALSFPETTGVPTPLKGGYIWQP